MIPVEHWREKIVLSHHLECLARYLLSLGQVASQQFQPDECCRKGRTGQFQPIIVLPVDSVRCPRESVLSDLYSLVDAAKQAIDPCSLVLNAHHDAWKARFLRASDCFFAELKGFVEFAYCGIPVTEVCRRERFADQILYRLR